MGIDAADVYSDYCCKRVCAEFLDAAGDFAAVFMDGTDGNGTGGISAGAQFLVRQGGKSDRRRKFPHYPAAYSA